MCSCYSRAVQQLVEGQGKQKEKGEAAAAQEGEQAKSKEV